MNLKFDYIQSNREASVPIQKKTIPSTKRPSLPPRSHANITTSRIPNHNMPLSDRIKLGCYKCSKLGHISPHCTKKTQNFHIIQNVKRPPQIRHIKFCRSWQDTRSSFNYFSTEILLITPIIVYWYVLGRY